MQEVFYAGPGGFSVVGGGGPGPYAVAPGSLLGAPQVLPQVFSTAPASYMAPGASQYSVGGDGGGGGGRRSTLRLVVGCSSYCWLLDTEKRSHGWLLYAEKSSMEACFFPWSTIKLGGWWLVSDRWMLTRMVVLRVRQAIITSALYCVLDSCHC